jgi:hypothetical protein
MYLDEMQDWLLVNQDIFLRRTTPHTKLQNAGLTYKLLLRQAAERDEAARNEWMAVRSLDFTARQGVWTDETRDKPYKIPMRGCCLGLISMEMLLGS